METGAETHLKATCVAICTLLTFYDLLKDAGSINLGEVCLIYLFVFSADGMFASELGWLQIFAPGYFS